ncbi:MAG TPA: hypothetical protein VHT26_24175 [Trebonia sp.]|nr:hypothetical protein [Trebonia sp.]
MPFLAVVGREDVVTEVAARHPPHRVHVVAAALRVVVLDQQPRALDAEVVPASALGGPGPREPQVLRPTLAAVSGARMAAAAPAAAPAPVSRGAACRPPR